MSSSKLFVPRLLKLLEVFESFDQAVTSFEPVCTSDCVENEAEAGLRVQARLQIGAEQDGTKISRGPHVQYIQLFFE